MQFECLHFVQDCRAYPDGTHDLIGDFNSLTAMWFPYSRRFWVFATLWREATETGAIVPLTMRTTFPNGTHADWTERPIMGAVKGIQIPTLSWRLVIQAVFPEPGYYRYEIIDTEFGEVLGGKRLLIRSA
jgi:hypothetical protein